MPLFEMHITIMGLAPYVLTFFLFFYFSFVQDFLSFEKFVKVEHDNMK